MPSNFKKQLIEAHYTSRVVPGRDSYDILDWGSRESQLARFHIFVDVLIRNKMVGDQKKPCHVLDVGCGLSDLCSFMKRLNLDIDYTGVDIVPAIIAEAKRRYPARKLVLADIFDAEPFAASAFDAAFISGTFNLEVGNNEAFVALALAKMLPMVTDCLVANFLHTRASHKYDHCHYYDPGTIIRAIAPQVQRVELRDDYMENDFTLILWRR